MGQITRNQAEPTDRLDEATDETHCTLAQRIMTCGEIICHQCMGRGNVVPEVAEYVNSAIVDCVADCIDILRGDKNSGSVNNR